jgi:hypothetical protein
MKIRDMASIIHSFSKANVLDKVKLISMTNRLLSKGGIEDQMKLIDLAQLCSTLKHQQIFFKDYPESKEIWNKMSTLLE